MEHKHIYDKDGKQICCTQEEKNIQERRGKRDYK